MGGNHQSDNLNQHWCNMRVCGQVVSVFQLGYSEESRRRVANSNWVQSVNDW